VIVRPSGVISLFLVVACSSGGSGDPNGPLADTPEAACAEYGSAYCTRLDGCIVASIGQRYGDVATCKERVAIGCTTRLALSGSGRKPADVRACAKAIGAGTCNSLRGDLIPNECLPSKGTLVVGATCFDDSQCASAYCDGVSALCGGHCKDARRVGEACDGATICGRALVCTGGECVRPTALAVDDFCTGPDSCDAGLACQADRCQKPAALGEACDSTWAKAPACNLDAGLICISGTCVKLVLNPPGSPCDDTFSGPNQCSKSYCVSGSCRAFITDGGDCSGKLECLSPFKCDRSVCKSFDKITTSCGL